MKNIRTYLSTRAARIGGTVAAIGLLATGAVWTGSAAAPSDAVLQEGAPPAVVGRAVVDGRGSYADIVKAVAPAVVTVRVEGRARVAPTGFGGDDDDLFRRFFGQPERQQRTPRTFRQRGLGSGVVVSGDGYVLTNNHVIDSADSIQVELTDGRSFKATLVGADKPSDLALLKVEAARLPSIPLGNSDAAQVGDVVLAVGNPLGIGQTVTMGIVSAKGRSTGTGDGSYEDFLQTDAPINHGNSGGALVNMKGELIGINSQIVSPSDGNIGIGFAIPANMARRVMDDLRKDGRVRRAQLGVTVQPITSDLAESLGLKDVSGAIVSSVGKDSAAERAGVKRGDVIMSFNGQAVHDFNSLRNRVADTAPGTSATIGILRDGREQTLTVKLDEAAASKSARSDAADDRGDPSALGVAVVPVTPELAARSGLPRDLHGMLVQEVDPDGRAADAGLQPGDVIVEVNRSAVRTVDELRSALRQNSVRPALLLVNREGKDLFVTVRPS